MTPHQFCNWFYEQPETPEPSVFLAKLNELHAMRLAQETERVIKQKFAHRGWTTGKKLWEKRLLDLALRAQGKPGIDPEKLVATRY